MLRSPVIDVSRAMEYNNSPLNLEFIDTLLQGKYRQKSSQTFGFLADGVKNKYLEKIHLHQETRGEWKQRNKKLTFPRDECPICHGAGELQGYKTLDQLASHVIICLGANH